MFFSIALLDPSTSVLLLSSLLLMAILYSSVGHGGASGYLAAMVLFGLEPSIMKPAALTMNIFVTTLVLMRLSNLDLFNWRLFAPLAIASAPMAFIGGSISISNSLYQCIVAIALTVAAFRLIQKPEDVTPTSTPKLWITLPIGSGLGLLSGLTGVGGGIFLSPLLLFLRWSNIRQSAAIAAAFIWLNSTFGLLGYATKSNDWPDGLIVMVGVATIGAIVGAELCAKRLAPTGLRRLLGAVLLIASIKMFYTSYV